MKPFRTWTMTFALLAIATASQAATLTWTNTAGGSFQTAENWSPQSVPGGNDTAKFANSGTYTVTLGDHVAVTNLDATSGTFGLTLDLNGYTLAVRTNNTASFPLAQAAGAAIDLTVRSSAPDGLLTCHRMYWFSGTSASGNVRFEGSNTTVRATAIATVDNSVFSGASTGGSFTVADGAKLVTSRAFLFGTGSVVAQVPTGNPVALALITDPGSVYTNLGNAMWIGKSGTNMPTLVVSNGAALIAPATASAPNIYLGQGGDTGGSFSPRANGKLWVTGVGSLLDIGTIYAGDRSGQYGTPGSTAGGYLLVDQGAVANLRGSLYLGDGVVQNNTYGYATNLFAYGEVIVRGAGTRLRVESTLYAGRAGNGAIFVLDGARLDTGTGGTFMPGSGTSGALNTYGGAVTNVDAYGLLAISNQNSTANFRYILFGNYGGYGEVIVADNARLSVTNGTDPYVNITPRSRLTVSDAWVETKTMYVLSNATLRVELGARDPANAYLQMSNYLSLNAAARLELAVLGNAPLVPGSTLKLISYGGNRAGTFQGLPEGAVVTASGGQRFRIYYGDGNNDAITLKYLPMGSVIIAQ